MPVKTQVLFNDLFKMRRSPRRPLILKRRKLPFQRNDPPAGETQNQSYPSGPQERNPNPNPTAAASLSFPDGIRIMNHPSMTDTQVVVIPKTADLQSVIGALTAKGKECGVQGPNKFILLSENGSGGGGNNNGSLCQTAAAAGVSTQKADGQVKAETIHSSPDAKPHTAITPCMEIRLFLHLCYSTARVIYVV